MNAERDYRQNWNGRPVSFRRLTVGDTEPVVDLFAEGDGRMGGYLCLALALEYDDTKELVFANVADVRSQPASLQQRIWWLRMRALDINGFGTDEPPKTNGHGEGVAAPLH